MRIQLKTIPLLRVSLTALGVTLATVISNLTVPAQALTLVTERTELGGNDRVNWSKLIPPLFPAPIFPLDSTFSISSEKGLELEVEFPPPAPDISSPAVFQTRAGGIETNFADGDFILFSGLDPRVSPSPGNPGPLTMSLETSVFGAGTQIAVDDTFEFFASISAFDANDKLLGMFSAPGTSSLALDNSALFLGVTSERPNISKLVFETSIENRALGINSVTLVRQIPEPSVVLGATIFGVGVIIKGKRRIK